MFVKTYYMYGRLVRRIRAEGFARVWGTCLKYLKRGWNRKGGKTKILKGEGQAKRFYSRRGYLKKWGWNHYAEIFE